MKERLKKAIMLSLVFAMLLQMFPVRPLAVVDTFDVGTLLDDFQIQQAVFLLTEDSRLFVVSDVEPSDDFLQTVQLIQQQFAAAAYPSEEPMELVWGPMEWVEEGDVALVLDAGLPEEGYRLEVTEYACVTASDVSGLLYGANTLLKHFRSAGSSTIQGFTAEDAPDTAQRAVSLDCGRKYYTKDWICNFIRELSWMGYNTLELHFSDDSGFRIDIWDESCYTEDYQPKNDFSWICGSNYTSWTLSAYQNDPDKGKFLTAQELVEILQIAKQYHIDVIPAFDSPSHLDYLTWLYEQNYKQNPDYSFYSTYDNKQYFAADVKGVINYTSSSGWTTPLKWPYYSTVNVVNAQAKAFIFELYIDIADFFAVYSGSKDFSVGADEVNLNTANIASGYRFAWTFSDFVDYINELNGLLNDKGYTMRMYNDFMGSTTYGASQYDFADNIEILYWDSPFEPNTGGAGTKTEPVSFYVKNGRTLYNCIQTNTYYALRITGGGSDARSKYNRQWTFYHSNEEDIYNEWYPADISEHGDYAEDTEDVPAENLGGAYFLIWGDYACVSTEAEIWNGCYDATTKNTGEFYSLRDRMWSNAIKMWNWDINETVSYSEYAVLRDSYGDFPGCGSGENACSEKTVLPSATGIASGYSSSCEAYPAYCMIQIPKDTPIMSLPCDSATEASSVVVCDTAADLQCKATKLLKNTLEELWYRVQCEGGVSGYIKAEGARYICSLTDDILVEDATYPSAHIQGEPFNVTGNIAARFNQLTSVTVSVYSGYGKTGAEVTAGAASVNQNSCTLENSTFDREITFDILSIGEHTYVISVEYKSFYVHNGELTEIWDKMDLAEKYFLVLETKADQSTCNHNYTATIYREPTCEMEGVMVYSCTTCGSVYEEIVDKSVHIFEPQTIEATCLDYEKVRNTCTLCGYCYETYADGIMSQWQSEKPEGMDDALIESKEEYRFCDYETVISDQASLEGYEVLESDWVTTASGSVAYVQTWPSGFNAEHDLYQQYHCIDKKVEAFEEEGKKRVIDSDQVTGYLYYHWCYSGSFYSVATQSGNYQTFHAYFSTVAPSNYTCDYSDMSYRTDHSTCSNSQWFFVTSVYTQSYTDYEQQYTHGKWSQWSDWTEQPIEAADNRKVEKQILYRYVAGTLGDHSWREGECTLCGTACDHTYENNICPFCGASKPLMDYYLFGHINGSNYGCEEEFEKIGEYRFANGQLTVYFTQDSYVGVKSEDNQQWYMTAGWQDQATSVTLYNSKTLSDADKLYVPGNMVVNFVLTDHGNDTYTLSYTATECTHKTHTQNGICDENVHHYENGVCSCGLTCTHCFEDGVCMTCGCICVHIWCDGQCSVCNMSCDHSWLDGVCSDCGENCTHSWQDASCTICGSVCVHEVHDDGGVCLQCFANVGHHYEATITQPTCTENGFTVYSCACGAQYVGDEVSATGHDYETVTIPAGCTEDGSVTDTCSVCGDQQVQTLPAIGHHYDSGTCTMCGEGKPVVQPTISPKYPTLSFEDEILMNVYFSATMLDDVVELGLITYSEKVDTWDVASAEYVSDTYHLDADAGLFVVATDGIAAKCLGDVIYFSVYAKLSDGTYQYSSLIGYSPSAYAYNLLSDPNSTTMLKSLVVAMLNYGAAAQIYFDYRTDALVNSSLTEEMHSLVLPYDPEMVAPVVKADVSKVGDFTATEVGFIRKYPSISFEGAFCINFYLEPQMQPEGEMLMYVWDDTTYEQSDILTAENASSILEMFELEQGSYQAVVEGIAAKELDHTVFVSVVYTYGEQQYCSGVINYHIGAYCVAQAKLSTAIQELAAKTAVYGYYAKAYFVQ